MPVSIIKNGISYDISNAPLSPSERLFITIKITAAIAANVGCTGIDPEITLNFDTNVHLIANVSDECRSKFFSYLK